MGQRLVIRRQFDAIAREFAIREKQYAKKEKLSSIISFKRTKEHYISSLLDKFLSLLYTSSQESAAQNKPSNKTYTKFTRAIVSISGESSLTITCERPVCVVAYRVRASTLRQTFIHI